MNWRHRAACRHVDPELFFPVSTSGPGERQVERAKEVCHGCPVVEPCLEWAMEAGQDFGVCGGMSEEERRAYRRRAARHNRRVTAAARR